MKWVVGSDEAGFGTWAGDLVVAACAVTEDWKDRRVTDSKKLKQPDRERAVGRYKDKVPWEVITVSASEIDDKGVWACLIDAHAEAHNKLRARLIEDGVAESMISHIADGLENAHLLAEKCVGQIECMAKADLKIPAVSLASCFAKTYQVAGMMTLDRKYPNFGFASHKGYGTALHQKALKRYGALEGVHRFSYSSIKKLPDDG